MYKNAHSHSFSFQASTQNTSVSDIMFNFFWWKNSKLTQPPYAILQIVNKTKNKNSKTTSQTLKLLALSTFIHGNLSRTSLTDPHLQQSCAHIFHKDSQTKKDLTLTQWQSNCYWDFKLKHSSFLIQIQRYYYQIQKRNFAVYELLSVHLAELKADLWHFWTYCISSYLNSMNRANC